MAQASPQILAHRAFLRGPERARENTLAGLADALDHGFGSEFDVNLDGDRLTLAHDPLPWSPERDALTFLRRPGDRVHALNVKRVEAVEATLAAIAAAGTRERFFLFDFELAGGDRDLMHGVAARGFDVAWRVSEREPHLDEYLADERVTTLWLDEWEEPWLREEHVRALAARGKRTFYVSPELHRPLAPAELEPRWREVAAWGLTGICTDFPIALDELLRRTR